jgi:hypothetical protein
MEPDSWFAKKISGAASEHFDHPGWAAIMLNA